MLLVFCLCQYLPIRRRSQHSYCSIESSWNVMAHGDEGEGKWRGNWRMKWVACTLHTTSEYGVFSITTADAHTSAASSRLNWRPRRFKWTRPFRWKTKSGLCACAITFQTQSTFRETSGYCFELRNGRIFFYFTSHSSLTSHSVFRCHMT